MQTCASLDSRGDVEVAAEPTAANRPSKNDTVPGLRPVTAGRLAAKGILPGGCDAQARWAGRAGEVPATEGCAEAVTLLHHAPNPTSNHSFGGRSGSAHGEGERAGSSGRRGEVRQGPSCSLPAHSFGSRVDLAMDAQDHLICAQDLPTRGTSEDAGIMSCAPPENAWLHLPAEPAMNVVLAPCHEGMVPAGGPPGSTAKTQHNSPEDRLIADRVLLSRKEPRAIN